MNILNSDRFIEELLQVVYKAGSEVIKHHKANIETCFKEDGSPVTEADKASDKIILDGLGLLARGVEVISEENVTNHASSLPDTYFLVDPLDGTKEFLKNDGAGGFTINVALIRKKKPILGVVYAPAIGRMFYCTQFGGAFENGKPIKVRKVLRSGPVAVASVSHRDQKTDNWLRLNKIQKIISIGSSLKLCLLACGEADVYPRFSPTMEWDIGAGHAILNSAGGRIEQLDGEELEYGKSEFRNGSFIAFGGSQRYNKLNV